MNIDPITAQTKSEWLSQAKPGMAQASVRSLVVDILNSESLDDAEAIGRAFLERIIAETRVAQEALGDESILRPRVAPVMQTRRGVGGNCLAACLASIFDIRIESVPELATDAIINGDLKQNVVMREWLRSFGFDYIEISLAQDSAFVWTDGAIPSVPCLLAVRSKTVEVINRGFGHFVVGAVEQRGDAVKLSVLHDPNGMQASYEATAVGFFVPIQPRHPARPIPAGRVQIGRAAMPKEQP